MVTHKDRRGSWIDDPVTSLRSPESDRYVFELSGANDECVVGSAPECTFQLHGPSGFVSRRHARLTRTAHVWTLHDLGSTNGVRLDGDRRLSFQLTPGVEIEIGDVKLVAESARLSALRGFLARLIGWSEARRADVAHALQALRDAAIRSTALVLCGAGDLTPTARHLHELAFGEAQPFVIASLATASVSEGTHCVFAEHVPTNLAALAAALRESGASVRLVICASTREQAADTVSVLGRTATIDIPPLATRTEDLDRLFVAYAADAVAGFTAPGNGFREHDMEWLRGVELTSLDEIAELCRRVVAVRNWGVKEGARRLGISHVALGRWLRRRHVPT
jgi:FHA domain